MKVIISIARKCYLFKLFDVIYQTSKCRYLKKYCKHVGKKLQIYGNIFFYNEDKIVFGNNVSLNEGVILNARGGISIGDNSVISAFSQLQSTGLDTHDIAAHKHINGEITIGKNVWICANVIVVGPATVGNGSIIAAHSLVKGDIPPHEVRGGIPAKKIKSLL